MYICAAKTDVGVYESHNEDRILINGKIMAEGSMKLTDEKEYILAAVCDGVGGLAQGDTAARITLETLRTIERSGVTDGLIRAVIEEANDHVREYQQENKWMNAARTTLAGIYAEHDVLIVFNAGDSRVYRFRHKYMRQLSKDHSYVQDMIDLGELDSDEAKTHPKRNMINKCIGDKVTVDPQIMVLNEEFIDGDILLLCSDGISDVLTTVEMQKIIYQYRDDMLQCCEEIYQKALGNGTQDNMSVILIRKEDKGNER